MDNTTSSPSTTDANTVNTEAETLENRLKTAWQFLSQTHITLYLSKKTKTLDKLPWYLLIGASGSGKTQLIKQAGLKLIAASHLATNPHDESGHNKNCNFWFTDLATIIDMPGNYLEKITDYLAVLKKYTRRKPLAGILVTLNLADWIRKTKKSQHALAQELKQALHAISKELKATCSVELVLTHVDCIAGFNEFFAELGREEREQAWGLTFNTQATTNSFKTNYDRLLKRLHERVIWRLQQERNTDNRAKIQAFPTQIEALKESLANCIYQWSDIFAPHGTLSLTGMYFVSNLQDGTITHNLHKPQTTSAAITTTTADKIPSLITQHASSAYFSQRLLKKIIFDHPLALQSQSPTYHVTRKVYWAAAVVVLLSISIMTYAYNSKTAKLDSAHIALAEYREAKQNTAIHDHDLNHNLLLLNHLQQAVQTIEQSHLPWLIAQGLRQQDLKKSVENTYKNELNTRFLPSIGAMLEQTLQTNRDPNVLYSALKTYLMLGSLEHFDARFIQHWLGSYWQQTLSHNPTAQQQLNMHLNNALLTKPIVPITLNQTIVAQARNTLNNADPTQLAYAVLKNRMAYTLFNPLLADHKNNLIYKDIFPNLEKNIGIANIYTANQFQTIYFQQIKQACEIAVQGDWIIGKRNNQVVSKELIRSVQTFYLKDYAYHWQAFLNSLQLPTQQSGQQLLATLDSLLGHRSPLIALLKTVENNTTLAHLLPADQSFPTEDLRNIQANLVKPFSDINHFASSPDGKQPSLLDPTLTALRELRDYIDSIASNKNSSAAAFKIAKNKFTNITDKTDPIDDLATQAESAPMPIQNWLNTLAKNGWHYILNETGNYLADAWQKEVLPEYNLHVNSHYPIFKNVKQDMTLEQFTRFFGPKGIIHNYFATYLAPFVDITTPTWQWRNSHGDKINLNNKFLVQLERAAIIKTMFFNNQAQPQVRFSLRLQSFNPDLKQLQFTLNDESFTDKKSNKVRHPFSWPGLGNAQSVSIVFTNNNNQNQTLTFTGPWALFKLIDKSSISASEEDDQLFQITFDLNGLSARYNLYANNLISPFMPNIINEFRCPTNLR